jgi:hypothetical protein
MEMELGPSLSRLIDVGGPGLGREHAGGPGLEEWGRPGHQLDALLRARNGFFAFESALLVRPSDGQGSAVRGLSEWNRADLWKGSYDGLADGLYCFAEDVFGGQFCLSEAGVVSFDPETGDTRPMGHDLESWAGSLLADYPNLTGHAVARRWQEVHGQIGPELRLVPRIPFVLGGEFDLPNLHLLDSLEAMRFRASIAVQIRDLPDGASIRLVVE